MVPFETREMFPGYMTNQQIFSCMVGAVGVIGGIYGMVNSFIALWNSGAGVATLLSTVKNIFKIAGGWFMVGLAVLDFGYCVGWW